MCAAYRQSCVCRGRSLSAVRDCERYDRDIETLSLSIMGLRTENIDRRDPTIRTEIGRLEMDRQMAHRARSRAYARLLEPSGQTCLICDGKGYRDSPGLISGFARRASNVQRAEKIS